MIVYELIISKNKYHSDTNLAIEFYPFEIFNKKKKNVLKIKCLQYNIYEFIRTDIGRRSL